MTFAQTNHAVEVLVPIILVLALPVRVIQDTPASFVMFKSTTAHPTPVLTAASASTDPLTTPVPATSNTQDYDVKS